MYPLALCLGVGEPTKHTIESPRPCHAPPTHHPPRDGEPGAAGWCWCLCPCVRPWNGLCMYWTHPTSPGAGSRDALLPFPLRPIGFVYVFVITYWLPSRSCKPSARSWFHHITPPPPPPPPRPTQQHRHRQMFGGKQREAVPLCRHRLSEPKSEPELLLRLMVCEIMSR